MEGDNKKEDQTVYPVQRYEAKVYPAPQRRDSPDFGAEEEAHLRDYVSIVLRRKKVVAAFLFAVFILTMLMSLMMTPVYKSTVIIKIDKETSSALTVQGLDIGQPGVDYYQTQYELLKSRALAERVVKKLSLGKRKDFLPAPSKWSVLSETLLGPLKAFASVFTTERRETASQAAAAPATDVPLYLSNSLISRLTVSPIKNSQLVKVSFEANSSEVSAAVTNAVAEAYIEYDLDSRIHASKQARDFLETQVESTKKKVEDSERMLNQYAARNAIIFVDSDKLSINNQKLSELSASLSSVSSERIQKEALYRQIKESGPENPVVLNNPLIQGLAREHATLEAEYFNLSRTYTADYPKMKSLRSQMDSLKDRMEKEKASITTSLESDYHAALRKEAHLNRVVEAQKQKVLDFQQKSVEYMTLKREVDVNKELHNTLLQKLNQIGVSTMSTATNIQVVDKALSPAFPYKPNIIFNLLLSIFLGLAGGVGLTFVIEYFDNTVKDTRDLERWVRIPTLGLIPHMGLPPATSPSKMLPASSASGHSHRPLVASPGSSGPVAEAFRSLGTFILLSSSEKPPKTILFTSCEEKVGKSTVSINTASALTESLAKGVLIDADLRRPRLHHALGIDNTVGLSTLLSGNIDFPSLHTSVIKQTRIKGLSIITSGPVPPNPSELLVSARMQDLLDILSGTFDFIVIDAAPIMGLADPLFLSSIVDGTVLVAKSGSTPRKALVEARKLFHDINSKLLGVVLNGVKGQDLKYGSYNYYYSSYFKE